jgi:hypothetical protein
MRVPRPRDWWRAGFAVHEGIMASNANLARGNFPVRLSGGVRWLLFVVTQTPNLSLAAKRSARARIPGRHPRAGRWGKSPGGRASHYLRTGRSIWFGK